MVVSLSHNNIKKCLDENFAAGAFGEDYSAYWP
jgi:hypothetical protein